MKAFTETRYVGEKVGPIDWAYDFASHDWAANHGGVNPDVTRDGVTRLREVCAALESGRRVEVMMHQNFHEVIDVGMYDGWPFWRPVPSVCTRSVFGAEWHPWYDIQRVEQHDEAQDATTAARTSEPSKT